jgi:hypothetical protein
MIGPITSLVLPVPMDEKREPSVASVPCPQKSQLNSPRPQSVPVTPTPRAGAHKPTKTRVIEVMIVKDDNIEICEFGHHGLRNNVPIERVVALLNVSSRQDGHKGDDFGCYLLHNHESLYFITGRAILVRTDFRRDSR